MSMEYMKKMCFFIFILKELISSFLGIEVGCNGGERKSHFVVFRFGGTFIAVIMFFYAFFVSQQRTEKPSSTTKFQMIRFLHV